ncbi:PAS domain-containing protein [Kitasatospora saccharophila]|uniref:PAS domain-containing protein n=1 Tax=Kitasatospora saccharophila TaxID=407973 RepID=UPI00364394B9
MRPDSAGGDSTDSLLTAASAALRVDRDALVGALLDQLPVALAVLDGELRWRYLNPPFQQVTGVSPTAVLGRAVTDPDRALPRVLADGRPRSGTFAGRAADFRRLEVAGAPTGALVVLPGGADTHRAELERVRARFAKLEAGSERIGTTLEPDTTCAELAAFAVPDSADLALVDVLPLDTPDTVSDTAGTTSATRPAAGTGPAAGTALGADRPRPRLRRAAAVGPATAATTVGSTHGEQAPHPPDARPPVPTGGTVRHRPGSVTARALAEGRPVVANLLSGAELATLAPDDDALSACRAAGVDCLLAVPLTARGRPIECSPWPGRTAVRSASPMRTPNCSPPSPGAPRSPSTTPGATPVRRTPPWTSNGPCSPSPAARTPISNSPPATCRPGSPRWSAATGTRPCGCRSDGPCSRWAT